MKKSLQRILIVIVFWLVLLFIGLMYETLYASPYIYPVAADTSDESNTQVYYMVQHARDSVELWQWSMRTNECNPVAPTAWLPSHVAVIPNHGGVSFIDNGLLRIIKPGKRLPKTIEFNEYISDIRSVHWIDHEQGYFWAKKHNRFAIFTLSLQGATQMIAGSRTYDCMYPCKVNDALFYIERSDDGNQYQYEIVSTQYPTFFYDFNDTAHFDERVRALMQDLEESEESNVDVKSVKTRRASECRAQTIVQFGERPIGYLQMISEGEGLVIEHLPMMNNADAQDNNYEQFCCHHIYKEDVRTGQWQCQPLFHFTLPSSLIVHDSPTCLHELLKPLIPVYDQGHIYFCSCGTSDTVNVFLYDTYRQTTEQKTFFTDKQHALVPLPIKNELIWGRGKSCESGDFFSLVVLP